MKPLLIAPDLEWTFLLKCPVFFINTYWTFVPKNIACWYTGFLSSLQRPRARVILYFRVLLKASPWSREKTAATRRHPLSPTHWWQYTPVCPVTYSRQWLRKLFCTTPMIYTENRMCWLTPNGTWNELSSPRDWRRETWAIFIYNHMHSLSSHSVCDSINIHISFLWVWSPKQETWRVLRSWKSESLLHLYGYRSMYQEDSALQSLSILN